MCIKRGVQAWFLALAKIQDDTPSIQLSPTLPSIRQTQFTPSLGTLFKGCHQSHYKSYSKSDIIDMTLNSLTSTR